MKNIFIYMSLVFHIFAFNAEQQNMIKKPLFKKTRKVVRNPNTTHGQMASFYAKHNKPFESKVSEKALNAMQELEINKIVQKVEAYCCAHQLSLIMEKKS